MEPGESSATSSRLVLLNLCMRKPVLQTRFVRRLFTIFSRLERLATAESIVCPSESGTVHANWPIFEGSTNHFDQGFAVWIQNCFSGCRLKLHFTVCASSRISFSVHISRLPWHWCWSYSPGS